MGEFNMLFNNQDEAEAFIIRLGRHLDGIGKEDLVSTEKIIFKFFKDKNLMVLDEYNEVRFNGNDSN